MASSGSADEDFQSRVSKIFGSLAFSRSSSSAPASSRQDSGSVWSLSAADVEKREWKREPLASYDRDEMPCASDFQEILRQQRISSTARKQLEDDLRDLDCSEDNQREGANGEFDGGWSIRASMGLDRTLDDEAEEDEYDKLALGKENGGESLSVKLAFSKSSCGRIRDPRANLVAAKIRLKEDEIESQKNSNFGDHCMKSKESSPSEESYKAVPPKPILKRKENSSDSEARTSKRVRFDFVSEETSKKTEEGICSASASLKFGSIQSKSGAQVPDYLINPSKYTRYSFDPSSELDDKSATQEYIDIPKDVEGLETLETESFKKISFIPKKKTKDVSEENSVETKGIGAGPVVEDERSNTTIEDGDTETGESERCTSFQRKGRQYRAKLCLDETDV